ncbi:Interferon-induced GTP-binding protein Mx1 [Zalerion maritima]|uniref:Interferon-induced GTP-binding protein Mx1 n=1 Tax=Zalerion maritima TaxID=339359 RepID=A0AAD5RUG2_9PEZI|nr:Interferon-induced GTP-binding protein Mx1 [Zalerion maritima]
MNRRLPSPNSNPDSLVHVDNLHTTTPSTISATNSLSSSPIAPDPPIHLLEPHRAVEEPSSQPATESSFQLIARSQHQSNSPSPSPSPSPSSLSSSHLFELCPQGPNSPPPPPLPTQPQDRSHTSGMTMSTYIKQEDVVETLGNQLMLSKIDKLRELNVGSIVPLPQLVVVGDQSSGKSSVLESLTGFSFPRATTLCTRYATQITCKRNEVRSVEIGIIPGPHASNIHKDALKRFHRQASELSDDTLAQIFDEANAVMGIRGSSAGKDDEDLPTFSEDVLKIVINGPTESHLTVIDVPGIFRTSTEGVTTEQDISMVRSMVQEYMKENRTIILAVIPCNVDIATQEILKLARDADPEGKRTMGVLTKPDLAVEMATKRDAIQLVNGNRNMLRLGYCVVKNRGADDISSTLKDSNCREREFFAQDPWHQLSDSGRTGIESLRQRLRELLMDICKKEFPKVKLEIKKRLAEGHRKLNVMGPSRAEPDAQRIYLGNLSDRFQRVTQHALDATYTHNPIFHDRQDMRLITRILELNEVFANIFWQKGHTRYFSRREDDNEGKERRTGEILEVSCDIRDEDFSDICDILEDKYDCPPPDTDSILDHVEHEFQNARGRELGTVPVTLLATTFKDQTKKWEPVVLSHVSDAICLVHHFIRELLEMLCPEKTVRDELWDTILLEDLRTCYKKAIDHAKFLLEVERESWPTTLNHSFTTDLEESRTARLMEAMEAVILSDSFKGFNLDMVRNIRSQKSIAEHARNEIHDALKAYYKVAGKRFVDVLCQQVVDHFLLTGKASPLAVFCNERVNKMTPDQLDMIAGEDSGTRRQRSLLTTEIHRLDEAMKVLRG